MWRIRRLWERLYNLYRWAPVIWRDVDYDWAPLFQLMEFKVRNMRLLHDRSRRFVGWERTVRQLQVVEVLLRRIGREHYCEREWGALFEKYPRSLIVEDGYMTQPSEAERREVRRIMFREQALEKQDMQLLCKYLSRYYRGWWD